MTTNGNCSICGKPLGPESDWFYLEQWEEEGESREDVPVHNACYDKS